MKYHGFAKPSPRLVSTRVMTSHRVSPDSHHTHMLMQWGQFVDHDIDNTPPAPSIETFSSGADCER